MDVNGVRPTLELRPTFEVEPEARPPPSTGPVDANPYRAQPVSCAGASPEELP
jgi:hypothetical protein